MESMVTEARDAIERINFRIGQHMCFVHIHHNHESLVGRPYTFRDFIRKCHSLPDDAVASFIEITAQVAFRAIGSLYV